MFARRRKHFGTPADKATYATLHTASLATPSLREGLTPEAAGKASKHLRDLLGTAAIAICDTSGVLAWDGVGGPYESNHRRDAKAGGPQYWVRMMWPVVTRNAPSVLR
jgi:two-component system LytT family sensor kinase